MGSEMCIRDSVDTDPDITFNHQAHKRRKMGEAIEELKILIGTRFDEQKEESKAQNEELKKIVGSNTLGIERNRDDIQEIRGAITKIEHQLRLKTATGANATTLGAAGSSNCPAPNYASVTARPKNNRDEVAFNKARRSLRIWPIAGQSNEEIGNNLDAFLRDALGIDLSLIHI